MISRGSDLAVDPGDHLMIELHEIRDRAGRIGLRPAVGHIDALSRRFWVNLPAPCP